MTQKSQRRRYQSELLAFLFFTYYVCPRSSLEGAAGDSARAEAVATRTDRLLSSQSGSSLNSSWYVEPVLSWLSWKIQSSADISSILQIW